MVLLIVFPLMACLHFVDGFADVFFMLCVFLFYDVYVVSLFHDFNEKSFGECAYNLFSMFSRLIT